MICTCCVSNLRPLYSFEGVSASPVSVIAFNKRKEKSFFLPELHCFSQQH